jgi:uncharacterized protein (TIGR02099 family)
MSILKFSRFIYLLVAIGLVVTALLLTAMRYWLLPHVSERREDLTSAISAIIGESIQIKSLSAGMKGLRPEVTMRGFSVENANTEGPALNFERLTVGLDMLNTVITGKPVVNRIGLTGAKVRLSQRPDGGISVSGLKSGDTPLWLFAEGEVRLTDIDMEWDFANGGAPMHLGRAQLRLRNEGDRHWLDAKLDLPGKLGKLVKASVEITGNPLNSGDWQGKAYIEAKRLREGAFIESFPLRLRSGEAGVQAWVKWKAGALSEVIGKLDLDRPVFVWRGADGADGLLNLDKLAGWVMWHKEDNGWLLGAKHLNLSQRGRAWPETDFTVAVSNSPDNTLQSLRAAVNYLRFDDAQALIEAGLPLLDTSIRDTLHRFTPKGEVRNARLVYETNGHFGFCGQLVEITYTPPEGWPNIGRVNGHLCGNDRRGGIEFTAAKPEMNLPSLWKKPIVPDMLSGGFQWHRSGDGTLPPEQTPFVANQFFAGSAWHIVGHQLALVAPGIQGNIDIALDLPEQEVYSPAIDMTAHFPEVEADRIRDYLPLAMIDANSAKWLSEAFVHGKLKNVDVLLRGYLSEFPFRQGQGLFEVKADSENMEMQFNPDWPHLYDINAKILLFGPSLFVDAPGGRIGNIPFHAVHAETGDYLGNGWLGLNGNMDGEFTTAMKFLRQTSMRFFPERLSKVAEPAGPFHLDMNLLIPLASGSEGVGVGGLLELKRNSLALKGINMKVQEVTGTLSFTGNGMEGKQLFANIMDEPVLLDVAQKNGNILLDILGKASVPSLRKAFPGEFWKHAEGDFSYHLNVQMPESLDVGSKPMRFNLATDLAGLELRLPAPLVKPGNDKKLFNAEPVMHRGDHFSINLAYGTEGRARLLFNDNNDYWRLEGGDVVWEKPQPSLSGQGGLGLFLKMNSFDAGEWRKLIAGFGAGLSRSVPRELDIQIGKLKWFGEDFGPLTIRGKRESGELFGDVDFVYGKGSFGASYAESNHLLLKFDLDHLLLPKFADVVEGQVPSFTPDPAHLPALHIRTRHLMRQGMDWGGLELETEHVPSGINIRRLGLLTDNHNIDLSGSWLRENGRDETKLEGRLKINELNQFLSLLGYGEEIYRTPAEATIALEWEGSPQQFSAATLAGDIRFKLGRGKVLQMDQSSGQALSMLNLQTLRKVLMVDFSHLFGRGLAFDSMEGAFHLWGGQARTKGLLIDAVTAEILVFGRVGLVNHDSEQTISVIPSKTSSSSVISGVIDMAHRLMSAEDVNLASTNYAVTGSWDDPHIQRIQGGMPLEMVNRAWSDFRSLPGVSRKSAEETE